MAIQTVLSLPRNGEPVNGYASRFSRRLRSYLGTNAVDAATVRLPRNATLYTCGDYGNTLYLIDSGRIKTVSSSPCGKGCLLDIYAPGEVVGESCLRGPERTATATAMVPTILRRFPREQFMSILAAGHLLEDWLRCLTARLSDQQQLITLLVTVESEQRLAVILLRLARKLGTPYGGRLLIDQKITHQELSEMVGTTRSRVGFFLKRFRDSGLVEENHGSTLVINERRLAEYVVAWS